MSSFVIVKMPHVIKKAPYYIIVTVNDVVSSPQISTIHSRISLYIVQRLVHIAKTGRIVQVRRVSYTHVSGKVTCLN